MLDREKLQTLLEEINGSGHVYFQPPENVQMVYPAIVYQRDDLNKKSANNASYNMKQRYQVTVIDRNPDSVAAVKIAELPLCTYQRFFVVDNLNHDVFNLYF
jgi:hypothetical protein